MRRPRVDRILRDNAPLIVDDLHRDDSRFLIGKLDPWKDQPSTARRLTDPPRLGCEITVDVRRPTDCYRLRFVCRVVQLEPIDQRQPSLIAVCPRAIIANGGTKIVFDPVHEAAKRCVRNRKCGRR